MQPAGDREPIGAILRERLIDNEATSGAREERDVVPGLFYAPRLIHNWFSN